MAPKDYAGWYEASYPELHRHGLWLRGGELNTLPAAEHARRPFRVLFARLSTYYDTGYSFTHQLLYQVAADTPGTFPDLAYLPPRRDLPVFARDGVPWLLGTQAKLGPEGFDVVGFSNSIVQELVNVPAFLEHSGVPASKRARLERPDLPLILLGGANALYTSAIWGADPPVDGIFVGESDDAIRRILEICRDEKAEGASKREILARLDSVDGFFQPDAPHPTRKSFVSNLNTSAALERGPVYHLEEQLGRSHLQISEGCPCFCSFCAESWDRKPYRERKAPVLREVALRAKAAMGLDSIDIYSFNFNMHSGFYQVIWDLVPLFRGVGLKSQRFDLLAHDPAMVEFQHAIEKASLTCGLEGISPRLRRYLHKNLESDELHKSLEAIFRSRARAMKVFLIATGLEEDQDFEAFSDFLGHVRAVREAHRAGTRVVFSMTPLVRFPWTPLEFEDAPPIRRYHGILRRTARAVRSAGFEFRESADLPDYWVSQVLVRAADERVLPALLEALRETGFVYYREIPMGFARALRRALRTAGLDPEQLLLGYTFEESRSKPWAAIDTGVKREFLWEEVLRSRKYKEIDYCLGRAWTKATCFQCGGCPTPVHVADIVLAKQERSYGLEEFRERIRAARSSETEVCFAIDVGPAGRGVPRKMVAVALARALMLTEPELAPGYRGYAGSAWVGTDEEPAWIEGEDVLTLRWSASSLARIEALVRDPARRAKVDAQLGEWGKLVGLAGAGWAPPRLECSSRFAFDGEGWLRRMSLTYTLRRVEGGYAFELSRKSLARDVVRWMRVTRTSAGDAVEVVPGKRFAWRDFARQAFALPRESDWVRVRLISRSTAVDERRRESALQSIGFASS